MRKKKLSEAEANLTGERLQVPFGTLGTLIAALNDASYSDLYTPIKENDALIILGSTGFKSIADAGLTPFGLKGGEWFILDVMPDGTGAMGEFNPNTGEVAVANRVAQAIVNGSSNYSQNDTLIHEVLHRAFAILHRLINSGDSFTQGATLRSMLPQDLLERWRGGWGYIDYNKYPIRPTSTGNLGYQGAPLQRNPEHAMLYTQLKSDYAISAFVTDWCMTTPDIARNFGYTGGEYYDGISREAIVRYWDNLYDETEAAVTAWLINHLGETSERLIADDTITHRDDELIQELEVKLAKLQQLLRLARATRTTSKIRKLERLIAIVRGQLAQATRYGNLGRPSRGGAGIGRTDIGQ